MSEQGKVVDGAGAGRFVVYEMVEKQANGTVKVVGYLVSGPGTGKGFSCVSIEAATAKAIELDEEHLRPKSRWE